MLPLPSGLFSWRMSVLEGLLPYHCPEGPVPLREKRRFPLKWPLQPLLFPQPFGIFFSPLKGSMPDPLSPMPPCLPQQVYSIVYLICASHWITCFFFFFYKINLESLRQPVTIINFITSYHMLMYTCHSYNRNVSFCYSFILSFIHSNDSDICMSDTL